MRKKIKNYINELCYQYGMNENKQAKKMLINDFISTYEECLKMYDKDYEIKKAEFIKENNDEDEDDKVLLPLPENEEAFKKAKEIFGTKAIIDKTYRISHNYTYYNKMRKAYIYIIRSIIILILLTSFYGIGFAKTSNSKINTLLLWVVLIVLGVGFVIVSESTHSKVDKIFDQLKGKLEYFYVKTDDKTLFNVLFKERDDKHKKKGDN